MLCGVYLLVVQMIIVLQPHALMYPLQIKIISALKKLVGSVSWNIGAIDSLEQTPNSLYNNERGTKKYKMCTSGNYCNDCNEPDELSLLWKGLVGLMHPSDYGYATSGGSIANRTTCLNKSLSNCDDSSATDCKNNDWLFNERAQFTLSSYADLSFASNTFIVSSDGFLHLGVAYEIGTVHPVIYLSSNVKISSGTGFKSDPFMLEK